MWCVQVWPLMPVPIEAFMIFTAVGAVTSAGTVRVLADDVVREGARDTGVAGAGAGSMVSPRRRRSASVKLPLVKVGRGEGDVPPGRASGVVEDVDGLAGLHVLVGAVQDRRESTVDGAVIDSVPPVIVAVAGGRERGRRHDQDGQRREGDASQLLFSSHVITRGAS